ncbi:MAG: penicillin-binding transpeptidase domain-containing protein [Candidatus Paceibacterota bacterium]
MLNKLFSFIKRRKTTYKTIDPDEIFLDSQNLPEFNVHQFEGKIEKPIGKSVFAIFYGALFLVCLAFVFKLWNLQIVQGETFRERSENNRLHNTIIFADRGNILDRKGKPIVWNTLNPETPDFSLRVYATSTGLSTTLGYLKYPAKDSSGFYYQYNFDAKDGIEKIYDDQLRGINGKKILETNVSGYTISESVIEPPKNGNDLTLSIDTDVQKKLYEAMIDLSNKAGFKGGSGIIMDVRTGEIIALANFPEYESQIITDGTDKDKINKWLNDSNNPFLNRAIQGLYTPGSIMKIFVGLGVLEEGVIDPSKKIISTGSISIPNPYVPDKPSVFNDWKAHGAVDFRQALAVSSNIYFYSVTGGYKDQKGIGIANIQKYVEMFGFGTSTEINFPGEKFGIVPNPEWKKKVFDGEIWRLGDTYNTAIGQYGFQVTPIQSVVAVSAVANGGNLLIPTLIKDSTPVIIKNVVLDKASYRIVKEGMRLGVTNGTSASLNVPYVKVASKTGTAQIGLLKNQVNSWVVGFFPYENPKYAYAVIMERGSSTNQFGAVGVMREVFDWMNLYANEYLQ